jgi:hypothetical protein
MDEKFNPLDPLGLFGRRAGQPTGQGGLPDPLHLFGRREQTGGAKPGSAPPLPDPLGIFARKGGSSGGSLLGATLGNPIPIEWANEIIPLKNQAREILIARGYKTQEVDMALHWAEEWLMGMARRLAPGNTELQKTVVVSGYSEIAFQAEKWLHGIEEAFRPVAATTVGAL